MGATFQIKPPALNHSDYYNRKGWYSMVLQGVIDHEYLFRDVYVGWPGSVHDAAYLPTHNCSREQQIMRH